MRSRGCPVNRQYTLAKSTAFKQAVLREMERQCMTRSEFATRMGWTRSAVSHFFNEDRDLTLGTADLCGLVLGRDATLTLEEHP